MSFPIPPPSDPENPEPSATSAWVSRVRAWGRRHPWRFTAWFVAAAFGLASVLPVWTAWYFSPWEANGDLATFWQMAHSAWTAGDSWHLRPPVGHYFWPEAVKLAVLVALSAPVGRWLAGNPDPPEAADYDDRFTPPAPDGVSGSGRA